MIWLRRMATNAVKRPLVVAGPSGAGKSTLITRLMKEFPDKFGFSVSHTSRAPRAGEQDGVQYFFRSIDEIRKLESEGGFIETAIYAGNLYGTSKKAVSDVLQNGRVCILDIDMQGVKSVKKADLNAVYVFVEPPSLEVLEQRLILRGEKPENINNRLEFAKSELVQAKEPGMFDKIIVNEELEKSYREFKTFVTENVL